MKQGNIISLVGKVALIVTMVIFMIIEYKYFLSSYLCLLVACLNKKICFSCPKKSSRVKRTAKKVFAISISGEYFFGV